MLFTLKNIHRIVILALCLGLLGGCTGSGGDDLPTIQNRGSDTLLEVAQTWSENYDAASVEVSGGGSGVGVSALISGTVDIANCSRAVKESEAKEAKEKTGKEPVEFIVGYDALAIYVHKDNPLEEITIEQLAGIFGQGGTIKSWDELGVTVPGCDSKEIVLAGRQSSSGTYEYFRTTTLGKEGKFSLNINEQNGSRALVTFVSNTPCAIGYSGMGYKTDSVKFVKVKKDASSPAVLPSTATVHDKTYPVARPLFMYTLGEPEGPVKEYMNYVRTPTAQELLVEIGYVPLPASEQTQQ